MRDICPNLADGNHRVTSPNEPLYNCVAWSIENQLFWIWPDAQEQYGWPVAITRAETTAAFIEFFELFDYQRCGNDSSLEQGYEKVAIFEKDGVPTHVARQLANTLD